ncbi:unnamed protein product [Lactuca saligna]|uniref:Uncharacterized protein n=1 Tax=Lactuca saligna TaxID=75948 RepID=A0AA35YIV9_LACSI|nr:unnamed protein product [Lactuca saligna]
MEVNNQQYDDMPGYDLEYEQDDGTEVYLGDLVREKVGMNALGWKKVTPEVKEKLWEEITRFFEVGETGKQFVMNRLGILLWNFKRKFYADYIKPHLGNPKKLAKSSFVIVH